MLSEDNSGKASNFVGHLVNYRDRDVDLVKRRVLYFQMPPTK